MPYAASRRTFLSMLAAGALPGAQPDLANDPDRPRYHFLPPANWMNDPNGPAYVNGEYHLYYQHNPKAAKWDTMHWGHAVSKDLLHWKHLPISLAPTPGGPDKDGCFTGLMIQNNGVPTIIYTGVNPEMQCLATSKDLQHWEKRPEPILSRPPEGLKTPGFRDPHVWRDGDGWLMLIGAGLPDKGGTALLYESKDLLHWTYLKPLLTGTIRPGVKDPVGSGAMWECPEFFPVGKQWLLHVSTQGKVLYWLGDWENRVFTPRSSGTLVHGAGYAPKSFDGPGGRRMIWAWLREQRSEEKQLAAGWSGSMSLAVVPSLGRDGGLRLNPAVEYEKLRGKRTQQLISDCCEIRTQISGKQDFTIARGSGDLLAYDAESRLLTCGRSEAHAPDGKLDLRVFVDGSVVEVFVNSTVWLTGRVYADPTPQVLRIVGAESEPSFYPLQPVSKDRLTT